MTQTNQQAAEGQVNARSRPAARGCLDWLYKNALLILIVIIVGGTLFSLTRAAVYKIRPYERGLHLRGEGSLPLTNPAGTYRSPLWIR